MQRFTRDNTTLELINQTGSIALAEEFGEVVLGHAKEFYSIAHRDLHENTDIPTEVLPNCSKQIPY